MDNPSWIAVGFAAVALVGSVFTGFYAWRTQRDKLQSETRNAEIKLQFDAEMLLLKEHNKQCDQEREDAKTERAEAKTEWARMCALLEDCKKRDEARDEREKLLMSYIRTNATNIRGVDRKVEEVKITADTVKQDAATAKQLAETLAATVVPPPSGDAIPKPDLPPA